MLGENLEIRIVFFFVGVGINAVDVNIDGEFIFIQVVGQLGDDFVFGDGFVHGGMSICFNFHIIIYFIHISFYYKFLTNQKLMFENLLLSTLLTSFCSILFWFFNATFSNLLLNDFNSELFIFPNHLYSKHCL